MKRIACALVAICALCLTGEAKACNPGVQANFGFNAGFVAQPAVFPAVGFSTFASFPTVGFTTQQPHVFVPPAISTFTVQPVFSPFAFNSFVGFGRGFGFNSFVGFNGGFHGRAFAGARVGGGKAVVRQRTVVRTR